MEHSYDLPGIVKFALRREVMAWRTYDKLSQMAHEGEAVNMLLQLVGFEVDHVKQFTVFLRPAIEAAGIDVDAVVARAEDEPLDLGGYIDEERLAKSSLPELLVFAAKFEQAMATFYASAAAAAEDADVRKVLERLAGEERSHEKFIGDLIGSLTLNPEDAPKEFPSL